MLVDYLVGTQVAAERLQPQGYIAPPAEEPSNHLRFFILERAPST